MDSSLEEDSLLFMPLKKKKLFKMLIEIIIKNYSNQMHSFKKDQNVILKIMFVIYFGLIFQINKI
jgi:hypothetical protein